MEMEIKTIKQDNRNFRRNNNRREERPSRKLFFVDSVRMVNYLIKAGFDMVGVRTNAANSHYSVFCFDDCPEIREKVHEYMGMENNSEKE